MLRWQAEGGESPMDGTVRAAPRCAALSRPVPARRIDPDEPTRSSVRLGWPAFFFQFGIPGGRRHKRALQGSNWW